MNKGRKYYDGRNKRRAKQTPGYVREYAYDQNGFAVMQDGTKVAHVNEADKSKQAYRERPNRALKRVNNSLLMREK
jgi:hypothetical protein